MGIVHDFINGPNTIRRRAHPAELAGFSLTSPVIASEANQSISQLAALWIASSLPPSPSGLRRTPTRRSSRSERRRVAPRNDGSPMQTPSQILSQLWTLAGGEPSALQSVTLTGTEP